MVTRGNRSRRQPRALVVAALTAVTAVSGVLLAPGPAPAAERAGAAVSAAPAPVLRLVPTGRSGVAALDVPLAARPWAPAGRDRARTARLATSSYSMLGLTWQRSGADPALRVRVRADGGWTRWRDVEVLHDLPDAAGGEGIPGLAATEPLWVGPSDGVQVEAAGTRPAGLELALIDPGVAAPAAGLTTGLTTRSAQRPRHHRAPKPRLLGRAQWGADASWRQGTPTYNRTIQQVHVHHTATGNGYSRDDVPALIRGMYRYHTHNLGWSDLGYNFLVDRYGRTWVGRAGGARKAVRGAHTLGFNDTSTGIAVIGDHDRRQPSQRTLTAIVRLAAWKLDRYHRRATGTVAVWSHGSDRYAAGTRVRLPAIDGHRDTNETACPGEQLYSRLPGIRRRAQERIHRF